MNGNERGMKMNLYRGKKMKMNVEVIREVLTPEIFAWEKAV